MLLIMKIFPSGGDIMNYIEKSQDFIIQWQQTSIMEQFKTPRKQRPHLILRERRLMAENSQVLNSASSFEVIEIVKKKP